MLLQNTLVLENVIVRLLTQSPQGLSAQEILKQVGISYRTYSRRGIFKELQRLIEEGVIMRTNALYTLRLAWIISLQNEIESISKQLLNSDYLKQSLPSKQKSIVINCSDLVAWDRAWTQLMLVLHVSMPALPMFIWCPRHWFSITHPEIESTFTKANESKKHLRYAIIGGRSVLDFRDRPTLAKKSTAFSFRESPFEYDRNHYYWIIGDYVGISTVDKNTAQRIDKVYQQTKNVADVTEKTRTLLLSQKIRGTVRCDWAPEKAEKIRAKFLKFFDLQIEDFGKLAVLKRGEF